MSFSCILKRRTDPALSVCVLACRGDSAGALQLALQDPPYGNESYAQAKVRFLKMTLRLLSHTRLTSRAQATALHTILFIILQTPQSSVDQLLSQISQEAQDSLMKYIYAGMAQPVSDATGNAQCAALLAWHARLTALAGVGCIGRAMVDHRRV